MIFNGIRILLFTYLFSLICPAGLNALPVSKTDSIVFEKTIANYSNYHSFQYDAIYKIKYFDEDSFITIRYQTNLMSNADTIFGCYFFYQSLVKEKLYYKYYDGAYLYVIDTNKKEYTRFTPKDRQTSPITGASDGKIIEVSTFFHPDRLKKLLFSKKDNLLCYDTVVKKTHFIACRTNFEDQEDFTNQFRIIYINPKAFIIEGIYTHVAYKNQVQIMDLWYENFKCLSFDAAYLNSLFQSRIKPDYQKVIYHHRVDTLALESSIIPFTGKIYPDNTLITLPKENRIEIYDFWYTSCFPCIKAMPALNKLYEKYKNKVDFYAINPLPEDVENPKNIRGFLNRTPIYYPVLLVDYKDIKALKINFFPTIYIVGAKGKLLYKHYGFNEEEDLFDVLDKQISTLLQQ